MNAAEELFDVVNEQDEVIHQAPRSEVHRMGWKHRAVHIMVQDPLGRVYLQKRSALKDCHPGTWDTSCSGHVDAGETYDIAAIRELEEELGIRVPEAPKACFKIPACPETGSEFTWVYQLNWSGPIKADPLEIEEGDWFHPQVIHGWTQRRPRDFAPAFLAVWSGWYPGRF